MLLAQLLGLVSKALRGDTQLRRYARIVGSALFSRLNNANDDGEGVADDTVAVGSESTNQSSEEPKVIENIDDQAQVIDGEDEPR